MYSITIIFSYKLKKIKIKAINNRKTKPMVETKTAQYVYDIELHSQVAKRGIYNHDDVNINNKMARFGCVWLPVKNGLLYTVRVIRSLESLS